MISLLVSFALLIGENPAYAAEYVSEMKSVY